MAKTCATIYNTQIMQYFKGTVHDSGGRLLMFDVIMLANYPPTWLLADFKPDIRTLTLSELLASLIHVCLSWCIQLCGTLAMQNKKIM